MFPGFANSYHCFIQGFSKIAKLLISMLKITNLFENSLTVNNVVEDNELVFGNGKNYNTDQNLSKTKKITNLSKFKKITNLAKSKKLKNLSKLSIFKKKILNKSKILLN